MSKFLTPVILFLTVFLSSCSKQIQAAESPQEKLFFQIMDIGLWSILTVVGISFILGWISIELKKGATIALLVISISIFSYIEFFQTAVHLPL